MTNDIGILLEGGAMRSVFSAGVLDFLMEKRIEIPNILAVSAGAYAGMNYVSDQKGRSLKTNVDPLRKEKYMGFGTFLKKGSFFDMDLMFDEMPRVRHPFDFERFFTSRKRFITSTVNCNTGECVYFDDFSDRDEKRLLTVCRAANSMPFIAPIVPIDGEPMLDGGVQEAIPIKRALEEGWKKIIVVFTRDSNYRKKPAGRLYMLGIRLVYRKYPKLLEVLRGRADRYNAAIETVAKLEKEGRAFVLRPSKLTIGNAESNVDTLLAYYQHGYDTVRDRYEELLAFLEKD